jgi:hypothetical protein
MRLSSERRSVSHGKRRRRRVSVVEHVQVEPRDAVRVDEDVDLDDLPVPDRERADLRAWPATFAATSTRCVTPVRPPSALRTTG